MYRQALRLSGGRDAAAEDVVQEAWARALRKLRTFEGRAKLGTWLASIVRNCALERIRADRRHPEELPDPDEVRSRRAADLDERLDLERVVEALPPGFRAVLLLHDVEGHTHDEIGELLGVSAGTSKSQLSRGRAWVRRALGSDYRVESEA